MKSKSQDPPQVVPKPNDNGYKYICLNCFKKQSTEKNVKNIHKETYYELGMKYVSKIPTPEYLYARKCLSQAKKLEEMMSSLEKTILKQI